jgi:hypothetical protein
MNKSFRRVEPFRRHWKPFLYMTWGGISFTHMNLVLLPCSYGEMHFFHRTLTMCSFATVLFMSLLQCVHPTKSFAPFESNFFARMVLCHLLAISISTWTMSLNSTVGAQPSPDCAAVARWSIPGMALFVGSVCAFMLIASIVYTAIVLSSAYCFNGCHR